MSSKQEIDYLEKLYKLNEGKQEILNEDNDTIETKIYKILDTTSLKYTSLRDNHFISDEIKDDIISLFNSNPELFINVNNFNDIMGILLKHFLDSEPLKKLFRNSLKNEEINSLKAKKDFREFIIRKISFFVHKGTFKNFRSRTCDDIPSSPSLYETVTTDYLYEDEIEIKKLDNFINDIMNEFNSVNETI